MLLDKITKELGIKAEYIGNQEFESMGLVKTHIDKKICSFLADIRYINDVSENVKLLLVTEAVAEKLDNYNLCIVKDPRLVFFKVHNFLLGDSNYKREDFKTVIGSDCKISKHAYIADKNVVIGNNVVVEEFVSIKEHVKIGDNSIIRAGTIIGGEGFEFKKEEGNSIPVKHGGGVNIGRNVELQQNNCVDKAIYPWDDTIIGDYCKTDNVVHIAHAVKMGRNVLIAAHTCVAGRVTMEDNVWIGPGVTLINGMTIGKNARVNIGSVATRDVEKGGAVTGNFAIEHSSFIENLKKIRKVKI